MNTFLSKITKDKKFSELLSGSGLVLAFKLIGMVSGYVFSLLITKMLGAEAYGVYALCFTILNISVMVAKLGLDNAIVKSISANLIEKNKENALLYFRKSVVVVLLSSLVLSVCLYFSAPFLANVFDNKTLEKALKITALIILPNALLHLQAEKFRAKKKMAWYSFLINGSIALFASLLLVVLVNMGTNIPEVSLWSLAISILLLLVFVSFKKEFNNPPSLWNSISYKSMFSLSIPMLFSGSMFLIMSWTDVLLLGYFLDEVQVAIYSIALKLSAVVSVILYAINAIASPQFAELFASSKNREIKVLAQQIAKLNFFLTLPVMFLLVTLSGFILGIFGNEYLSGKTALYILCCGQFFSAICGSVLTLLNMVGKEKTVRNIVSSTTILNVILNIIFIKLYGIEGAALATFISLVTWNVLGLIAVKKYFGFIMLPFFK